MIWTRELAFAPIFGQELSFAQFKLFVVTNVVIHNHSESTKKILEYYVLALLQYITTTQDLNFYATSCKTTFESKMLTTVYFLQMALVIHLPVSH